MALNDTAHPVSLRQFLQAQAYVVADFFQPQPKKSVAGSPLITIAATPFYRCSICCRETSVGGELQSLCLLTQCLWPKFYKFKFATIRLEDMEAREPQHPAQSTAVLYFAAKESLWHQSRQ
jgi:hypothetical protein